MPGVVSVVGVMGEVSKRVKLFLIQVVEAKAIAAGASDSL